MTGQENVLEGRDREDADQDEVQDKSAHKCDRDIDCISLHRDAKWSEAVW